MTGSRGWVLAAFLVTFLAGVAVDHGVIVWRHRHDPLMFRRPPARPDMVMALTRALDLSPVQQDSARVILSRHRCDLRDIWRVAHPRFDSLRLRVDSELAAVLNPDQRAKFLRLAGRHEHRSPPSLPSDSGCAGS